MITPSTRATRLFRLAGLCLVSAALALAAANHGQATAGAQGDSQVKLTATAGKVDKDGKQVVTIKMQINKGWHAYANPVLNKQYEENRTKVEIKSAKKLEKVEVAYPTGKQLVDKDDKFQVYEGTVEIMATVKRAAGDTGPLEVTVDFVTCNDKLCGPPETVKLQVK